MTSITWKHGLVLNRLRLRWQLICDRNDWCTRWQLFCHFFFFYIDFLNPIKCKKEKKFIVQSFLRTSFCKTWKFLNVHKYLIFNIFLINGNISSYEIVNIFFFLHLKIWQRKKYFSYNNWIYFHQANNIFHQLCLYINNIISSNYQK